ncbi:hypothetical protein [Duganella violaceipulchra]|uniref:Uncharacterized protein n=1 Tax=Duganella violaceipulchra TaxID=2849652 RepID=A0AA41HDQ0_9BURK|nr:hypothetical protein [Duganella violaceicalia]MBV6321923.1 hypothetical protein [Duganella violaceicalia]MCP2007083.1 hypothetical protein [Duganella violaceicalia]
MGFADKYVWALGASTLQDDETHHATEPLFAAAVADTVGIGIGALLSRVKFADGSISKVFESGTQNLPHLIRTWSALVAQKGEERKWVKIRAEWDVAAASALYARVAQRSLAHWLDGKCKACCGTGVTAERRICQTCKGNRAEEITGQGFEANLVKDMISELDGLLQAHNARAAARLRREPAGSIL